MNALILKRPAVAFFALLAMVVLVFFGAKTWTRWRAKVAASSLADSEMGHAIAAADRERNANAGKPRSGTNAADVYKKAYEMFQTLSKDEKEALANPRAEMDADKAAALFSKLGPIMDLLLQAQGADYCDRALGAALRT